MSNTEHAQCIYRTVGITADMNNIEFNTLKPRQNVCHFADNIFKCIFERKSMNFAYDFTEICFVSFQLTMIDNGLVPSRRQAIIRTNVAMVHRRIHASLGLNVLITETV